MKQFVFSLALLAGLAFAANNTNAQNTADNDKKQLTTQNEHPGFVDNDADGICDNYDGNHPGKGLGPGHGNGLGRGHGRRGKSGTRTVRDSIGGRAGTFVDTNNNGTCDNLENGTEPQHLRDGSGGGTSQNKK
jgi:hypothetical protein